MFMISEYSSHDIIQLLKSAYGKISSNIKKIY